MKNVILSVLFIGFSALTAEAQTQFRQIQAPLPVYSPQGMSQQISPMPMGNPMSQIPGGSIFQVSGMAPTQSWLNGSPMATMGASNAQLYYAPDWSMQQVQQFNQGGYQMPFDQLAESERIAREEAEDARRRLEERRERREERREERERAARERRQDEMMMSMIMMQQYKSQNKDSEVCDDSEDEDEEKESKWKKVLKVLLIIHAIKNAQNGGGTTTAETTTTAEEPQGSAQ